MFCGVLLAAGKEEKCKQGVKSVLHWPKLSVLTTCRNINRTVQNKKGLQIGKFTDGALSLSQIKIHPL
jgi:hypothetical protein